MDCNNNCVSKKEKADRCGNYMYGFFFCYAVASLFLYNDNKDDFNPVHFFPFLYLYLMLMLGIVSNIEI